MLNKNETKKFNQIIVFFYSSSLETRATLQNYTKICDVNREKSKRLNGNILVKFFDINI